MAWMVLYETATGRHLSSGDAVAVKLPAGVSRKLFTNAPDLSAFSWDPASVNYVADPVIVRGPDSDIALPKAIRIFRRAIASGVITRAQLAAVAQAEGIDIPSAIGFTP